MTHFYTLELTYSVYIDEIYNAPDMCVVYLRQLFYCIKEPVITVNMLSFKKVTGFVQLYFAHQ